jgi:trehalose 6-phosphate synthase/phosphatase
MRRHYEDCDPEWGTLQASQLIHDIDALRLPVSILSSSGFIEIGPQFVTKARLVSNLVNALRQQRFPCPSKTQPNRRPADFVLCFGDDRSDEDMFAYLQQMSERCVSNVITCTVGVRPSSAHHYVRSPDEFFTLLTQLADN